MLRGVTQATLLSKIVQRKPMITSNITVRCSRDRRRYWILRSYTSFPVWLSNFCWRGFRVATRLEIHLAESTNFCLWRWTFVFRFEFSTALIREFWVIVYCDHDTILLLRWCSWWISRSLSISVMWVGVGITHGTYTSDNRVCCEP